LQGYWWRRTSAKSATSCRIPNLCIVWATHNVKIRTSSNCCCLIALHNHRFATKATFSCSLRSFAQGTRSQSINGREACGSLSGGTPDFTRWAYRYMVYIYSRNGQAIWDRIGGYIAWRETNTSWATSVVINSRSYTLIARWNIGCFSTNCTLQ